MAHTTYSSGLFGQDGASLAALLRELFAGTPLAIFVRALKRGR